MTFGDINLPKGVSTFDPNDSNYIRQLSTESNKGKEFTGQRSTDKPSKLTNTKKEPLTLDAEVIANTLTNKQIVLEGLDSLEGGRKFDYGKPLYSLISSFFLKEFADVLTLGSQKYDKNNWLKVPDARERYKDALLRHIHQYIMGETHDQETGKHHLSHAVCNLMFLYELERLGLNP
jgi:hypothetical protein